MSKFTPEEIAYLQSQRYGRLATIGPTGELHVVPVTFRYHPELESIDIGGENLTQTKKYRDALRHGRVAFVVAAVHAHLEEQVFRAAWTQGRTLTIEQVLATNTAY
jgi:PPOX class F420-dependent enzyme/OxyR family protein